MRKASAVIAPVIAAAALASITAHAAGTLTVAASPPSGVLSLSAQASEEVAQDVVDITLFYEQEAKDAASLTDALNTRTAVALRQAKGVAEVNAHTGAFSIYPSTDRDGRISAWRGRTEVVLESRDFGAVSSLAGQLDSTMQVGNVAFSLSPDAQRAAAEKLTGEAIASFRRQAESAARAFGYNGYSIREVNVGRDTPPRPFVNMRAMAAAAPAAEKAMPIEGGKTRVTVNVSGSVQMMR